MTIKKSIGSFFSYKSYLLTVVRTSCIGTGELIFKNYLLRTRLSSIISFNIKYISMDNITKIWFGPLPKDSPYVQPFRFYFIQNGVEKNWDLIEVHDSVSIIIFNKTRNKLVFVKQFRPAVYHGIVSNHGSTDTIDLEKFPPKIGITLELCAGIVDKNKSLKEIAIEEVEEECGYNVGANQIEEVLTYRSGVGSSGALQTMYYCEVTDADKKDGAGGGVDDELIEVVEYSISEIKELIKQGSNINSPPSFLFGVSWFLANKATQ